MKELIQHIEDGTLFVYTLSDGGNGIVIANSPEEAEEKVRVAYSKHGGYENGNLNGVVICVFEVVQKPFDDSPDVLELFA